MKTPPFSPEILRKYLANECTAEEYRLVNDWYRQLDLPADEPFTEADSDRLYLRIKSYLSDLRNSDEPARPSLPFWHYAGRIAAILVVGLGLLYFLYQKPVRMGQERVATGVSWVTFTNTKRKIVPYLLPDSTVVWLHPHAQIRRAEPFAIREVAFSGEGFFDVKPDAARPFVIRSGEMQTKVLGTSFNIRAIPGEATFKVSVATGRVEVSDVKKHEAVVLKPAQEAVFESNSRHLEVQTVPEKHSEKELWQSASLVFNDAPMSEVADRLTRTFDVKIGFEDDGLADCRLRVDFTNQRLPEILEMIDTLLGSTYHIDGDQITLKGQGCH